MVNGPELDAAVRRELELMETDRDLWFAVAPFDTKIRQMITSLTGILDMHRPHETGYGEYISYVCQECYYHNAYPCPTVQEILDAFEIEYEDP